MRKRSLKGHIMCTYRDERIRVTEINVIVESLHTDNDGTPDNPSEIHTFSLHQYIKCHKPWAIIINLQECYEQTIN